MLSRILEVPVLLREAKDDGSCFINSLLSKSLRKHTALTFPLIFAYADKQVTKGGRFFYLITD